MSTQLMVAEMILALELATGGFAEERMPCDPAECRGACESLRKDTPSATSCTYKTECEPNDPVDEGGVYRYGRKWVAIEYITKRHGKRTSSWIAAWRVINNPGGVDLSALSTEAEFGEGKKVPYEMRPKHMKRT